MPPAAAAAAAATGSKGGGVPTVVPPATAAEAPPVEVGAAAPGSAGLDPRVPELGLLTVVALNGFVRNEAAVFATSDFPRAASFVTQC